MKKVIPYSILPLMLLLGGCISPPERTPQATMFATLHAAEVGIDSFRASYESAHASGQITLVQRQQCDRAYNQAIDAIVAAAEAARAAGTVLGLSDVATTEEVDRAVAELARLITTLIPPKER